MSETEDINEWQDLVRRAADGDDDAWTRLLNSYRPRLRQMVSLRLHGRLRERVDPSDIVQEVCLDAARRFPEFSQQPKLPFYLWLRGLAMQRLVDCFRTHLGAQSRDQRKEVSLGLAIEHPESTSAGRVAQLLVDHLSTPSRHAIRQETAAQLQQALEELEPLDREILVLRHFEELTNQEAADVLNLDKSAASKRYARALTRLAVILKRLAIELS
jgi:RNA polymerase sigma-70 factor (ECF subfamily)